MVILIYILTSYLSINGENAVKRKNKPKKILEQIANQNFIGWFSQYVSTVGI